MKKKLLLIEDDLTLAELTADSLVSRGFYVDVCNDAKSAMDKVNEDYSLIILDVNLPDATGFSFCTYVRSKFSIPIIFISARNAIEDKTHALNIGGDDYLEKPYSIDELEARINAILRRLGNNSTVYHFGSNELNIARRELLCSGLDVKLANKEFELLAVLAKKQGEAVSKESLMNLVWGEYSEVEDSTLSVHIRWLREKIEENPSKPKYILTVHGFGYKLVK